MEYRPHRDLQRLSHRDVGFPVGSPEHGLVYPGRSRTGRQGYSYGWYGWAIQLTQTETQWLIYGLIGGVAASAVAAGLAAASIIGAPAGAVAAVLSVYLAFYLSVIQANDHGNGVSFYFVWPCIGPWVSSGGPPGGYQVGT